MSLSPQQAIIGIFADNQAKVPITNEIPFPPTFLGQVSQISIFIKNLGAFPIRITDMSSDDPDLTIVSFPKDQTIESGQVASITLSFKPSLDRNSPLEASLSMSVEILAPLI